MNMFRSGTTFKNNKTKISLQNNILSKKKISFIEEKKVTRPAKRDLTMATLFFMLP